MICPILTCPQMILTTWYSDLIHSLRFHLLLICTVQFLHCQSLWIRKTEISCFPVTTSSLTWEKLAPPIKRGEGQEKTTGRHGKEDGKGKKDRERDLEQHS